MVGEEVACGTPGDDTELLSLNTEYLLLCSKEDKLKRVVEKFGTPQLVHSHSMFDKCATSYKIVCIP